MEVICTQLKIPGGNPAFSANAAMANADKGVSSAGLITTVHPQARAAAAFWYIETINHIPLSFILSPNPGLMYFSTYIL